MTTSWTICECTWIIYFGSLLSASYRLHNDLYKFCQDFCLVFFSRRPNVWLGPRNDNDSMPSQRKEWVVSHLFYCWVLHSVFFLVFKSSSQVLHPSLSSFLILLMLIGLSYHYVEYLQLFRLNSCLWSHVVESYSCIVIDQWYILVYCLPWSFGWL
jgi:hypothetical protein